MDDRKDISDMSFEEFFSEQKTAQEKADMKKAEELARKVKLPERGFSGASPKINYNAGKFLLYVPRYRGLETDQFNTAVEVGETVVPLQRLEASKQKGSRLSRPATLDLTPAGVSCLDPFILTIDGIKVFENPARQISFFNNIGSPMNKPEGDVTAIVRTGTTLKLKQAEVIDTIGKKGGLTLIHMNVSVAGAVWVDKEGDGTEEPEPEQSEAPAEEPMKEEPVKEEPKPKKKAAKKVTVKGELGPAPSVQEADVRFGGEILPLYPGRVEFSVSVTGCDPSECTVRVASQDADVVAPVAAGPRMALDTGDYIGPATVILEKAAKRVASFAFFAIPGFKCTIPGKGDITDETVVEYEMAGQKGTRDVSEEGAYAFSMGGIDFEVIWYIPYITYDIGQGPVPFEPREIDIGDITVERIMVTVRGAKKKSLFFGGDTGKKKDLTPDWEDDTYYVDAAEIRDAVLSSSNSQFYLFITVNSYPIKRFMVIKNPVRMKASFADGCISAEINSSETCVCRLYKMDKSVEEVALQKGVNSVPVSQDVIEAELVELHNDEARMCVPVSVRPIPFLSRDQMGDVWLYVSRSKRIPLPDGLIVDGKPNMNAVKDWHGKIVRMNPEIKNVTYDMFQKAFKAGF